MHEITESEICLDTNGTANIRTTSVDEEGHEILKGTIMIG